MKNKNMKIVMSKSGRARLKSEFGLSDAGLSRILNYHRESETGRRVRSKSINYYGGIIVSK